MNLLAIAALYVAAGSFIALIFSYINVLIPDPLARDIYGYEKTNAFNTIRLSIATLIVVFPAYLWTMRFLERDYNAHPEKRDYRVRKWLLHFTVFLAGGILIGNLVTLIYNLLGGDLTSRFLAKVAVIFFVAGSIFYYYYQDIKKSATSH